MMAWAENSILVVDDDRASRRLLARTTAQAKRRIGSVARKSGTGSRRGATNASLAHSSNTTGVARVGNCRVLSSGHSGGWRHLRLAAHARWPDAFLDC